MHIEKAENNEHCKKCLKIVAMFNPIKLSTKYINKVLSDGFRTSRNKNFNIAY